MKRRAPRPSFCRDTPKTVVSRLMRLDWATVGRMVERVVEEASAAGEDWLAGLRRIGIDEVSALRPGLAVDGR